MMRKIALALSLSLATPVAGDITLGSPIACDVGEDKPCYLQALKDNDPTNGVSDHMCGTLSYDGHGGTDFALRSLAQMNAGVNVIAAAPGRVRGVRDGMPDEVITDETRAALNGRDCGNGVVIVHANGWETQYCHLAHGSVSVKQGDTVKTGSVLGRVGLSGRTSFPHVHFAVRRNGETVDPFAPDLDGTCSAAPQPSLWKTDPETSPGGLISAGFATSLPSYDAVKSGDALEQSTKTTAEALVLWAYAYEGQTGDVLRLQILGPDGAAVHSTDFDLEKPQAQFFRASGRKTESAEWWRAGVYKGRVELFRKGTLLSDMDVTLLVAD